MKVCMLSDSGLSELCGYVYAEPGEPCVWGNKVIVSCFDLVTDEEKVNTTHEMPATMAMLDVDIKPDIEICRLDEYGYFYVLTGMNYLAQDNLCLYAC